MPDRPDIISGGRDPDRHSSVPWRLLAVVAAVLLVAGGITAQVVTSAAGHHPHHRAHSPESFTALTAPTMLHGTPLARGAAPHSLLFLGGDVLRLLSVPAGGAASGGTAAGGTGAGSTGAGGAAALTPIAPAAGLAGSPIGPDPAVQQVSAVAGGVVALISSHGSAGLPDVGEVLFIPVTQAGAGATRVIAHANYMAVTPDGRDVWVQQAGPPWGNGPAGSPARLVDETGRRLPGAGILHHRVLIAATVRGLLARDPAGGLALIKPVTGRARHTGIPADATVAGADASQVAWQAPACRLRCPLHVTDLRTGQDTRLALPPHTAIDPGDTSAFDPSGQRLALPLDTVNRQGGSRGTHVYVADLGSRTLSRVPGGSIPPAALPAVIGAFPAGSSDVVSVRWAAGGRGLWLVATDGLYFQAAYWPGTGPLRVLRPQPGLAYKFDLAGATPATG